MKHFTFVLLVTLTAMSCTSNIEKAEKLIDRELFKTLPDYESYRAIVTTVDSACSVPMEDPRVFSCAKVGYALNCKLKDDLKEYYDKQASISIFGNMLSSNWDVNLDEMRADLESLVQAKKMYEDSILFYANQTTGKLAGWKVTHSYHYRDSDGEAKIKTIVFFTDLKIENILCEKPVDERVYIKIQKYLSDFLKDSSKTN